ncbi:MAG: phosphoenolpyruvate--protein phosphotransferase [Leptospiraceae bacterium]|nr:phosphoenolpyruvate--protein phosphotransferase [Leptospiraceae bacterium]
MDSLRQEYHGLCSVEGTVLGTIRKFPIRPVVFHSGDLQQDQIPAELNRFRQALQAAREDTLEISRDLAPELRAIFEAQDLMYEDPMFVDPMEKSISLGINAEGALEDTYLDLKKGFAALPEGVFKERVSDLEDVVHRLLKHLRNESLEAFPYQKFLEGLGPDDILIAQDLDPSFLLHIREVGGIVLEEGGPMGHLSILASNRGIPTLVRCEGACKLEEGMPALLLAHEGRIVQSPEKPEAHRGQKGTLDNLPQKARPSGGFHSVRLSVNVDDLEGAKRTSELGAGSVGLMRTEFLYMKQPGLILDEPGQVEIYSQLLSRFKDQKVVLRLIDPDEDKDHPALHRSASSRGLRGPAYLMAERRIIESQLRCIFLASQKVGMEPEKLGILVPLVSSVTDLQDVLEIWRPQIHNLFEKKTPLLGAMLETPAACMSVKDLGRYVDFFSIGTNDLVRYSFATSRSFLAEYYREPGLFRMLRNVFEATDRPVSVCGQLGMREGFASALVGLGARELSGSFRQSYSIYRELEQHTLKSMQDLADSICHAVTRDDVDSLIHDYLHVGR